MATVPDSPTARQLRLAGASLIVLLAFAVYFPSLGGGFIFDDNLLLTDNPLIKSPGGVFRFWYTTQQADYVPLTCTALWFEWRLWGRNPTGYRLVNLVLHIAACLLIWRLLEKLAVPGAFLAALLFAIHPVNVESVAWVEQLKNTLALVFFLLSILWWLRAEEGGRAARGERGAAEREKSRSGEVESAAAGLGLFYWLSLLAFMLAMFSKGSVAILPALLLLIGWWQRGRIKKQDLVRSAPFFIVAAVLTPVIVWFVTHGSGESIRAAGLTQRLLGAGAVVWFYLSKAIIPIKLLFVYPQWNIRCGDPRWWLPLLAAAAVSGLLWRRRNAHSAKTLRPLLFAWVVYCLALAPVMGFSDSGYAKYSLVADHYQHIALIAVVALAAAAWTVWHNQGGAIPRVAANVAAITVVVALSLLTWRQNSLYGDSITLYETTLKENPDSWLAHNLLGNELLSIGRLPDAIEHFQQSTQLKPDSAVAHNDLGVALFHAGRISEAIDHYRQALNLKPDYAAACNNLGFALLTTGLLAEAGVQYKQALRLNPDFAEAYNGLGTISRMMSRLQEAIQYYQFALKIDPEYARAYANLSVAYAQANLPREAIAAAHQALELAHSQGNSDLARQIETWLEAYRADRSKLPNGPSADGSSQQK